jgi:hypothetical protein
MPPPKTTPKMTMKRAGKARFQKSAARLRRLILRLARTMARRGVMSESRSRGVEESRSRRPDES